MADRKPLEKIDSTPDLKTYVAHKKDVKVVVLVGASVRKLYIRFSYVVVLVARFLDLVGIK